MKEKDENKKAVIYIRVSTNDQSNSKELQLKNCTEYCTNRGLEIFDIITDEDVSGSKKIFERPGGKKLKQILDSRFANHVVSMKLDRMFRSVIDGLLTMEEFSNKKQYITLLNHGGQVLDTSSPQSKAFTTVMLALAEMEREMIAERTKAVLRNRKMNLKVYNKTTPYGFIREGDTLIPDKVKQKVVDKIFSLKNDKLSLRKIAEKVGVDYSQVYRILKNDIYSIGRVNVQG